MEQLKEDLLIIFVNNLLPGKVKTRLAKDIGNDQALNIYKYLIAHTIEVTKDIDAAKEVYFSEFVENKEEWVSNGFQVRLQKGNELGSKMKAAFEDSFKNGYKRVVLVGSDCLEINSQIIIEAFNKLKSTDTVIGPAEDGGFYLVGLSGLVKEIFEDKKWSTNSVLTDTVQTLTDKRVDYCLLKKLPDIDTVEDLKKYRIKF